MDLQFWIAKTRCKSDKHCLSFYAPCLEDSNIRGMDTHPNSVHSASLAVCFLSSAASDDAPAVAPTADKPFEFGGETTQISKAAGFRPSQSVISAGPDWDRILNTLLLSYPLCVTILLQFMAANAVGIELTPSKDQVYVAFENVSGICTFTCFGIGAHVVWTVDATTPYVVNKGISVLTSPDDRNITSRLSVPTIKSNDNTSVVCTLLDALYRNPQSAGPVILLIQGILGPPDQLNLDVNISNNKLLLSWIAPTSYDVSPLPAILHYILSNNVSNVSKIINSSCAPSMPCNTSLDLSDPLLLMSHNTSILEYNDTTEFTYYAVNGAGNGNSTTYILNMVKAVSAGTVVLSVTYVKCKSKGNVMNIQMNRNDVYDEINKMAPPKKKEMEACPAYGLVL
ncbi:hypothetical protein EMCRGX_G016989 [Ephydatia muelleri]